MVKRNPSLPPTNPAPTWASRCLRWGLGLRAPQGVAPRPLSLPLLLALAWASTGASPWPAGLQGPTWQGPPLGGARPLPVARPNLGSPRGPEKAGGSPKRPAWEAVAMAWPSPSPAPSLAPRSAMAPGPTPLPAPSAWAAPEGLAALRGRPLPRPAGLAVVERLTWRGLGLVIQADQALRPEVFSLHRPERLVVDLPQTEFGEPDMARSLSIGSLGIRQLRLAPQSGGGVRLVLDVADASRYQVVPLGADRKAWVVARAEERKERLAELLLGEGAAPGRGVVLQRLQWKQAGDRLQLELAGGQPIKVEVKEGRGAQWVLRLPGVRHQGLLPTLPGELLQAAQLKTGPDGSLELHLSLKPGVYQRQAQVAQGGRLHQWSWWRLEPRAFAGRPLVLIDPGHGGSDPGAIGPGGITEKEVCLRLALQFQQALRSRRINALLTRTTDEEVLLAPRLAMIDEVGADVFVSLHANAHTSGSAGLESYWREAPGRALAAAMQQAMVASLGRPDRGVKQERLYVLRHPRVPSTLVEVGFITHPQEGSWMATPGFRTQATSGLVAGLTRFWASSPPALGQGGGLSVGAMGLGLAGELARP